MCHQGDDGRPTRGLMGTPDRLAAPLGRVQTGGAGGALLATVVT